MLRNGKKCHKLIYLPYYEYNIASGALIKKTAVSEEYTQV